MTFIVVCYVTISFAKN